jgi:hypothetical protein
MISNSGHIIVEESDNENSDQEDDDDDEEEEEEESTSDDAEELYQYLVHLLLLQLQTHALAPSWCIFEDAITRAK